VAPPLEKYKIKSPSNELTNREINQQFLKIFKKAKVNIYEPNNEVVSLLERFEKSRINRNDCIHILQNWMEFVSITNLAGYLAFIETIHQFKSIN